MQRFPESFGVRDISLGDVTIHVRVGGAGPAVVLLHGYGDTGDMWARLVAGRERIYLDRFWNEFSADPKRWTEEMRNHYAALYALPGAMHAGFSQFAAFDQDAIDNRAWLATGARLKMPVLAIGGEKSF